MSQFQPFAERLNAMTVPDSSRSFRESASRVDGRGAGVSAYGPGAFVASRPVADARLRPGLAHFVPVAIYPIGKRTKLTDGNVFDFTIAVARPWRRD